MKEELKADRDAHVQEIVAKTVSAIENKMEAIAHCIRSERDGKIAILPVYRTACVSQILLIILLFIILSGVRLRLLVLRPLLAYCTSPRWQVMVIVEKLVEWRLAGETEVLEENLPQRHFVHHKFHLTRPGFEPGLPRWEACD
jgi:hypothetical protein